ncbi:MAG: chemotaxis protein, partial [Clostridiales bacterium]|nr:chemotaxis protein [Clostridiales bacterium]
MIKRNMYSFNTGICSPLKSKLAAGNKIIGLTNIADEKPMKTDSILSVVKGISSKTNLLGLNASIEASRVGEYGKGFNVIATEIRSLSKQVKESTFDISKELDEIKSIVTSIIDGIQRLGEISMNQASATEEITAALEEITSTF